MIHQQITSEAVCTLPRVTLLSCLWMSRLSAKMNVS